MNTKSQALEIWEEKENANLHWLVEKGEKKPFVMEQITPQNFLSIFFSEYLLSDDKDILVLSSLAFFLSKSKRKRKRGWQTTTNMWLNGRKRPMKCACNAQCVVFFSATASQVENNNLYDTQLASCDKRMRTCRQKLTHKISTCGRHCDGVYRLI